MLKTFAPVLQVRELLFHLGFALLRVLSREEEGRFHWMSLISEPGRMCWRWWNTER